ncbi:primase alpha helix C-terminal domain-containing protein [Staphylococcus equorum]|uniref:primase alpha helix C-terminal domain-containing protein n=1 Tax=Staphylococcus equorum TaxID=246432 RepID=UPI002DB7585D|nr:primase alpha helix C-terminal domain-containing protein [Staphylococcus equorum]MEB7675186.1 primase alpha helix C-terminal domain-containing protein [Staphylococcus equorum]
MGFENINLENDIDIRFQIYKKVKANSHIREEITTWNKFINAMQTPKINPTNKYSRYLALFGSMGDKQRKDVNVIDRCVLAIDIDDLTGIDDFIGRIRERASKYAYFIHSTYSSKPDKQRFRVLIPLDEPIDAKYYGDAVKIIVESFEVMCDEASYRVSQPVALPTIQSKESQYIFDYNDATILPKTELMRKIAQRKEKSKPTTNKFVSRRDSEYWRAIALGTAEGNRNQALTSIIGLLLRRYVNDSLVYGLTYSWSKQCTPPIDDKEFNKTFESIYKRHYKL